MSVPYWSHRQRLSANRNPETSAVRPFNTPLGPWRRVAVRNHRVSRAATPPALCRYGYIKPASAATGSACWRNPLGLVGREKHAREDRRHPGGVEAAECLVEKGDREQRAECRQQMQGEAGRVGADELDAAVPADER